MELSYFKDAINFELEGLSNALTDTQMLEFKYLRMVKKKLNLIQEGKINSAYYINLLPVESIKTILVNRTFRNSNGYVCRITNVSRVNNSEGALRVLLNISSNGRYWKMFLNTILREHLSISNLPDRYTTLVTQDNVISYLNLLEKKFDKYMNIYDGLKGQQLAIINGKVNSYTNKSVVTREAVKRAKSDIRKDATFIADAWNSTLTINERKTLFEWISRNVYSMRLWVLKDGAYDQAVTELFPDEQFGKKRRGEASEKSSDIISGYLSFESIKNAPMEIISKITKKKDPKDNFKKNKGSNKYRLNNYMLVLYLLQNYNHLGFVTGKTYLNESLLKCPF